MHTPKKSTHLTPRIPDPFDTSAPARLMRMGVLDQDGQLNTEVFPAFAGMFAGLFFDDLCDFFDDKKVLLTVCDLFRELQKKQDYQHMYLLLSLQYDHIRKPLPDPVWWLAGDSCAVREFMILFTERFEHFVHDAGFGVQKEAGDPS